LSDTVKVRIKQRPDEDLEVSAHEAEVLRGQGLLVEDKKAAKADKGGN
jgi:hypothetical protein